MESKLKEKHFEKFHSKNIHCNICNVKHLWRAFITVHNDISQSPSSFLDCKLQNAYTIRDSTFGVIFEMIKKIEKQRENGRKYILILLCK